MLQRFLNLLPFPSELCFPYGYRWYKSWSDTVDSIGTTLVTTHLLRFPDLKPVVPDRWIVTDNIWFQRTANLYKFKYHPDTNTRQLFGYIHRFNNSDEFFLQKAAEWALKELSRHHSDVVRDHVASTELPKLTVREGLKLLNKTRPV